MQEDQTSASTNSDQADNSIPPPLPSTSVRSAASKASTEPNRQGASAQLFAPEVRPQTDPTPVPKTWRNDADPSRRRATFQVPYPRYEIALKKKEDLRVNLPPRFENGRRTIRSVRMRFTAVGLNINRCDFVRCKFHAGGDNSESRISGVTFAECSFESCMLGGTVYSHVRFDGCTFRRCDFGTTEFANCEFEGCQFTECTAEHASLSATEIDPTKFLAGMTPPHYNYRSALDGEPTPEGLNSEGLRIRKATAAQLVKSNGEINNTEYYDIALAALKLESLKVRFDRLKSRPLSPGLASWAYLAVQYLFSSFTFKMTKGGTSIARLVLIAMVVVPAYALLLSFSSATFQGRPCHLDKLSGSGIVDQLTRASSLFLSIGYTSFSGSSAVEDALITLGALLGLFWYALLAAVIIRRVYR